MSKVLESHQLYIWLPSGLLVTPILQDAHNMFMETSSGVSLSLSVSEKNRYMGVNYIFYIYKIYNKLLYWRFFVWLDQ